MIFLYIALIVLLFIAIFFVIDYINGLKLKMLAHIDETGMDLDIEFLSPFIKVSFYIKDTIPVYSVHLFRARILKGELINDSGAKKNFSLSRLVKSAVVHDVNISASYGLDDPFKTGLLYGSLCAAGAGAKITSINQSPDFVPNDEYINFSADAKLYLGQTIINFIKNK